MKSLKLLLVGAAFTLTGCGGGSTGGEEGLSGMTEITESEAKTIVDGWINSIDKTVHYKGQGHVETRQYIYRSGLPEKGDHDYDVELKPGAWSEYSPYYIFDFELLDGISASFSGGLNTAMNFLYTSASGVSTNDQTTAKYYRNNDGLLGMAIEWVGYHNGEKICEGEDLTFDKNGFIHYSYEYYKIDDKLGGYTKVTGTYEKVTEDVQLVGHRYKIISYYFLDENQDVDSVTAAREILDQYIGTHIDFKRENQLVWEWYIESLISGGVQQGPVTAFGYYTQDGKTGTYYQYGVKHADGGTEYLSDEMQQVGRGMIIKDNGNLEMTSWVGKLTIVMVFQKVS